MKTYNVGVVGCGNISEMHFEAYAPHTDRIRLVAAFDPIAERVEAVKQKHGIDNGFATLEDMIAHGGWDVAVVCTPTSVRRDTVLALAAAGKHVFVEKPFADNFEDATQMVEACEAANVGLAVNQNFRYHYPFETAREIIQSGRIGNVVSIAHQDLMFRQDAGWRTQMPRHALSVMGVHWFDGFRWMLGAEARSLVGETYSSSAIDCAGETEASVSVLFEQGTLVTYTESFSSYFKRTETIVIGEEGTLVLDYNATALYDHDNRTTPREQWENPNRGPNKPKATFTGIDNLLTSLDEGTEPSNNGRDNLKTIALLDAAYRSASEHRPIDFRAGIPV